LLLLILPVLKIKNIKNMKNFEHGGFGGNRGDRGSDRRDFRDKGNGFGRHFGGNGGGSSMHKAVCGDCGRECEVPFRPSGARPVYCSDCFKNHGGPSAERFGNKSFKENNFNQFKPRFEEKKNFSSGSCNCGCKEQFEKLNAKMDRILKVLNPVEAPAEIKSENKAVVEKVIAPKAAVKKEKINAKKVKAKKKK
jgi:CxxC-x17-CxxC domain-containing protein